MTLGKPFVLAGADGCKAGWVLAGQTRDGEVAIEVLPDIPALLAGVTGILAIDMPIGLPDGHRFPLRPCDAEARRLLGPRRSSVFAAPLRATLSAGSHRQASDESMRLCGRGLSLQSWHLIPKIRELDAALTEEVRGRVHEIHPELAFMAMHDGHPLPWGKKDHEGQRLREALISRHMGGLPTFRRTTGVGRDDVLDALAALWSARRLASGRASHLGRAEDRDQRGLPMRISW